MLRKKTFTPLLLAENKTSLLLVPSSFAICPRFGIKLTPASPLAAKSNAFTLSKDELEVGNLKFEPTNFCFENVLGFWDYVVYANFNAYDYALRMALFTNINTILNPVQHHLID